MDLLEQPRDVLLEQLVHLPVEDLLKFCQVNSEVTSICQDRKVWLKRIANEFPGIDTKTIVDPRDFYLRQVLFFGEIYLHDLQGGVRLIPHETISWGRLPEILGPFLQTPVVVLYSAPGTDPNYPGTTPVSYQIGDALIQLGTPSQTPTYIDIYQIEDYAAQALYQSRDNNANPFGSGIGRYFDQSFENHVESDTPLFRREVQRVRPNDSIVLANPIVPRLPGSGLPDLTRTQIVDQLMLQDRFEYLLGKRADNGAPSLLGFFSYPDFHRFQEAYIKNLDQDQIRTIEFVSRPAFNHLDREDQGEVGIVFDSEGRTVFTTSFL